MREQVRLQARRLLHEKAILALVRAHGTVRNDILQSERAGHILCREVELRDLLVRFVVHGQRDRLHLLTPRRLRLEHVLGTILVLHESDGIDAAAAERLFARQVRIVQGGIHVGIGHAVDARLHERRKLQLALHERTRARRGKKLLRGEILFHELRHPQEMRHLRMHALDAGECGVEARPGILREAQSASGANHLHFTAQIFQIDADILVKVFRESPQVRARRIVEPFQQSVAQTIAETRGRYQRGHSHGISSQLRLGNERQILGETDYVFGETPEHGPAHEVAHVRKLLPDFDHQLPGGGQEILVQQDAPLSVGRRQAVLGGVVQCGGGALHRRGVGQQLRAVERGIRLGGERLEFRHERLKLVLQLFKRSLRSMHRHFLGRQHLVQPLVQATGNPGIRRGRLVARDFPLRAAHCAGKLGRQRDNLAAAAVAPQRHILNPVEELVVEIGMRQQHVKHLGELALRLDGPFHRLADVAGRVPFHSSALLAPNTGLAQDDGLADLASGEARHVRHGPLGISDDPRDRLPVGFRKFQAGDGVLNRLGFDGLRRSPRRLQQKRIEPLRDGTRGRAVRILPRRYRRGGGGRRRRGGGRTDAFRAVYRRDRGQGGRKPAADCREISLTAHLTLISPSWQVAASWA